MESFKPIRNRYVVTDGQVVGHVHGVPVTATLPGVLRGLIRPGVEVFRVRVENWRCRSPSECGQLRHYLGKSARRRRHGVGSDYDAFQRSLLLAGDPSRRIKLSVLIFGVGPCKCQYDDFVIL